MTGDPIFDSATQLARQRQMWLSAATAPLPQLTRRQCLYQARQLEWRIVDCATKAECRAQREADRRELSGASAA